MQSARSASRIARVALHLAAALPSRDGDKNEFRRRWCRRLLEILDIRLDARAIDVPPGCLLVANHVSWLDVIVLNALCPADFVAKAEIRRWPLIGGMLERHDCLFIDRRVGRHLLRLNEEIESRLARGRVVAFFPEGTTTDGAGVLPFRRALFEPAVRGAHPVRAFTLAYRDAGGRRCEAVAFIDKQNLWESLLAIASHSGIVASVSASPALSVAGLARREAAGLAQAAVQESLGWRGR